MERTIGTPFGLVSLVIDCFILDQDSQFLSQSINPKSKKGKTGVVGNVSSDQELTQSGQHPAQLVS